MDQSSPEEACTPPFLALGPVWGPFWQNHGYPSNDIYVDVS